MLPPVPTRAVSPDIGVGVIVGKGVAVGLGVGTVVGVDDGRGEAVLSTTGESISPGDWVASTASVSELPLILEAAVGIEDGGPLKEPDSGEEASVGSTSSAREPSASTIPVSSDKLSNEVADESEAVAVTRASSATSAPFPLSSSGIPGSWTGIPGSLTGIPARKKPIESSSNAKA